jgi:hypothetical protein
MQSNWPSKWNTITDNSVLRRYNALLKMIVGESKFNQALGPSHVSRIKRASCLLA